MKRQNLSTSSRQKGFTLIELLVVIAIIGILAAIGLSALTSARKKARDSRRKSDLREVANALELYYSDNGSYPQVSGWTAMLQELADEGYFAKTDVQDPLPTRKYCYSYCQLSGEEGLYYRIGADLEVDTDKSDDNDGGADIDLYEMGNALGVFTDKVSGCQE